MRKGDIYEGIIEQYDFPNKGSLMLEDRKVTVKGALEGQKIRFSISKKKSGMAEGRLIEVLEKAPYENEEPTCPYFGECGGCAYRTMSYDNQLELKEMMVKKLLDRVLMAPDSNSRDYEWEGILASPELNGYRNKMEFTFGDQYKDGPMALGLHKKGSFYDILDINGCEIIGSDWSKIVEFTGKYFEENNVPFYHRMRHEGILRNLVVRQSKKTGEFLINLVTATQWDRYGFTEHKRAFVADQRINSDIKEFPSDEVAGLGIIQGYVEGLLELSLSEAFEGSIAGILYTENDTLGDVVRCDRLVCLYGRDYIVEEVMGLDFKISPFSFFQTNTRGCEVLYGKAREYIMSGSVMSGSREKLSKCGMLEQPFDTVTCESSKADKIVFDLYSGTGTIAQMMAPASKKVIGIEIVEEAVEAAKENAALNGLTNCEFIAGDVLKAIDLVEDKPDVIILDPPRDGINPKALEKILAFGVDEMIYISCKPTSLARDLETIIKRGYKVVKACCVDQFPFTGHVETIVALHRTDM